MKTWRYELFLLIFVSAGLLWSGWSPFDRFTWWLETVPIWLGLPLLFLTARILRLTPLVYFI